METNLPRRRFLISGALTAGAFLVPGLQAASRSAANGTAAMRLNDDDQRIISELSAYSIDVQPWAGPADFAPPKRKDDPPVNRSTNFLVRVGDVERLVRYLTSRDFERLGSVYASGPHLAFFAGTTAFIVSNYGPEDFFKATQ